MGDISNIRSGDIGRFTGENVGERIDRCLVGILMGVVGLYGFSRKAGGAWRPE